MLKIIKERESEVITNYYLEFEYLNDPNAGFCFPAKANGEVDFDNMSREAKDNYITCLSDKRLTGPEFRKDLHTYINPAVGKCSCGAEVILDCDHLGAVMCECGRWYNLFGQSLRDPKYWEEDYED